MSLARATGYGLTARQRELLVYLSERDECPTFEEMGAALRLASRSSVHRLIVGLEERGYIRRLCRRARSIEVLVPASALEKPATPVPARTSDVVDLPLYDRTRINWLVDQEAR